MKKEKTDGPELDIAGLLALKKYEQPEARRAEKNIQIIMRTVRATNNIPSLLFFPDKSFVWMFAHPRYGIAALFVVFLGMSLMEHPAEMVTVATAPLLKVPQMETVMISVDTNQVKAAIFPGIKPAFSVAGEPPSLSSYIQ